MINKNGKAIKKLDELGFFGLVNMNVLFLLNMVVVRR